MPIGLSLSNAHISAGTTSRLPVPSDGSFTNLISATLSAHGRIVPVIFAISPLSGTVSILAAEAVAKGSISYWDTSSPS